MIKAYDRNDEKLYGEFQALKNQSYVGIYIQKHRENFESLTWMLLLLTGTAT